MLMSETPDYGLVKNILPKETCKFLEMLMFEARDRNEIIQVKLEDDYDNTIIDNANSEYWQGYNTNFFIPLLPIVQPHVENFFGVELTPTYVFCRILTPNTKLIPHVDRPSCQYSATVTISHNYEEDFEYPIYMGKKEKTPIVTRIGDGAVYKGCDVVHWREELVGEPHNYWIQAFFHYVDVNDKYAPYEYDFQIEDSLFERLKDSYV
jgi:hypothetical protein